MSFLGGYSGRIAGAGSSTPGTPAGAEKPRRPVGRPRKTAPAGQGSASQSAQQAASFSTPQPARASQATVARPAPPKGPVGQYANPYASATYTGNARLTGPPKDGTETQFYLIPGPTNRMLLSLRSGVPSQIDWALNKLVQSSYAFADGIHFEQLPGLYDCLLTFPRRVARAWAGAPEDQWTQEYFETDEPPEMYSPPEGHIAHERLYPSDSDFAFDLSSSSGSTSTTAFSPSQVNSHATLLRRALEASLALRNLSMVAHNTRWLTDPNPQAKRRVAEITKVASEVLRILRPKGIQPVITDADGNILHEGARSAADDSIDIERLSTLELEGLSELKAYMLDIFESIAPLVALDHGAPPSFGVVLAARQRVTGSEVRTVLSAQEQRLAALRKYDESVRSQQLPANQGTSESKAAESPALSPADSVFHSLLCMAHHSSDRNHVIAALRCLAALGGYSIRNRSIGFTEREWDVVEVVPSGREDSSEPVAYVTKMHSPGLLHLTALFLPLLHLRRTDPHPSLRAMGTALGHTALANLPPNGIVPSIKLEGDTDLGEAALDLLSQIVQIEGNALRIGMTTFTGDLSQAAESNVSEGGTQRAVVSLSGLGTGAPVATPGAPLSPASLFSFLTLLLPFQRVAWLRTSQLIWNTAIMSNDLPSLPRHDAAQRMMREQKKRAQRRMLGYREDEESAVERNMRKRLRRWEAADLENLPEPERAMKWMDIVFALSPEAELTQMEFWQSYQDEFRQSGTTLLNAAELIKLIAQVFPGASALVVKPAPNAPQRFVIKGIDIKQREDHGPLECRWALCEQTQHASGQSLAAHIKSHADACESHRLRCRWTGTYLCSFVAPEYDFPPEQGGSSAGRRRFSDAERRVMLNRHILTHLQSRGLEAMGAQLGPEEGEPRAKRVRVDPSTQLPSRHSTIDRPGLLYYTVARTPMDPASSAPIGTAAICSQILRSLARTASRIFDRAGKRPEPMSSLDLVPEGSLLDGDGSYDARIKALTQGLPGVAAVNNDDKFGFPTLPQDEGKGAATNAPAAVAATPAAPKNEEEEAAEKAISAHNQVIKDVFGASFASGDGLLVAGTWLGTPDASTDETVALAAAEALMDGLLSVENAILSTSGENDVLCPALNETLIELRPDGASSIYVAQ